MKKLRILTLILTLLVSVTACIPGQSVNFVTVDEIKDSLPDNSTEKTFVVGFDIDDTVLFSSPGFYYGKKIYGTDYLNSKKFWDDMNGEFDKFSLPKSSGIELLTMHCKRGDKIVFITARPSSNKSIMPEILGQLLKQSSCVKADPDIFYSLDKSKDMSDQGVLLYYGDSNSDISNAMKVNARPIRVMRPGLSTYKDDYNPGQFKEEVLVNSDK